MKNQKQSCFLSVVFFACAAYVAGATEYTYDAIQRLTQVVYDNGASVTYTYDAAGNRLTLASQAAATPALPVAATAGVTFEMALPALFDGAESVSVKGFPSGLKYDAATKKISGVAAKAGSFDAVISAGGLSQPIKVTVAGLPSWSQGTFNGYVEGGGLATMTVAAGGKITGKLLVAGTNYAFAAASYALGSGETNGFFFAANAAAGKTSFPLSLRVTHAATPQGLGVVSGLLDSVSVALSRDVWKEEPALLAPFVGYYTSVLPGNGEHGSGYLLLTVDGAGKIKAAGKLADGTAVSLTSMLLLNATGGVFTAIYTAPKAYFGGGFYGLAQFVKTGVALPYLTPLGGAPFVWENANLQATGTYGEGFARALDLLGGWYSKTTSLRDYYGDLTLAVETQPGVTGPTLPFGGSNIVSACWAPDGILLTMTTNKAGDVSGLVAPKAGLPTDTDGDGIWDYSADNVVGLKIKWDRPTGVFKGSFLAWFDDPSHKHTSKSISYEGVLTPERVGGADGVEGRGFFLWKDTSVGAPSYTFNGSYDLFLTVSAP